MALPPVLGVVVQLDDPFSKASSASWAVLNGCGFCSASRIELMTSSCEYVR